MVDSSVGGKTAVDLDHGKNQAGCFYQPSLVLCDPSLLNTLPRGECRAGCAEIIKYAVLYSRGLSPGAGGNARLRGAVRASDHPCALA